MRHTHFEIKNFKGIVDATIDLRSRPRSNVYTLVGLNESGKTTILEALHSIYRSKSLDPLKLPGYPEINPHDLIPMGKRSNFNGRISVTAGYSLSDDDEQKVREHLARSIGFNLSEDIGQFTIEQPYAFKDSKLVPDQSSPVWDVKLTGKKRGSRRKTPQDLADVDEDAWHKATDYLIKNLPTVLYFPNFLFEFPDRIYLESVPTDDDRHTFYRLVLQDVLDAVGEGADLQTHIVSRAKSGEEHDRRALKSVLVKMENHMTNTVFGQWDRIFGRPPGQKAIRIECLKDREERLCIHLTIQDGDELYAVRDRSLGFRWFLAFLLLTRYRGLRRGGPSDILFLFDEPASNLHETAQAQLLENFGKFPAGCCVIYTTHSHHMIDPEWLEGAFVVKNSGLSYEPSEQDYTARHTRITLERYREFAAKHPDQSSYFRPILAVLDYAPSKLENVPSVVMVEGKNDFYTLMYLQDRILMIDTPSHLVPGHGSGTLDDVIRLYLGWGRQFVVLLDSDKAGTRAKQRYQRKFGGLVEDRVFTLGDVDPGWAGKGLEQLIPQNDQDKILAAVGATPQATRNRKKSLNRAFQELHLTGKKVDVSQGVRQDFASILEFLRTKLDRASESGSD